MAGDDAATATPTTEDGDPTAGASAVGGALIAVGTAAGGKRVASAAADPGARVATAVAEAVWLVLLVALPAVFNPAGTLAFEPLKASVLRAGAALLAGAWLARRLGGRPERETVDVSGSSDLSGRHECDASDVSGSSILGGHQERDVSDVGGSSDLEAPGKLGGSAGINPGGGVDVGRSPVVRAGLGVIAVAALSSVFSVEPAVSFFGSFDRGLGWLSLAAGGVLLVSGADLFADARRRERAITALLIGAVIPCAYLLVQRVGLDPIAWTTQGTPGSSLASPTFLGGYLVMVAPFAAYRVVRSARTASIAYAGWLALLLVIAAVTVLTTIRGPILGMVAGVVTFAVLASPRRRLRPLELSAGVGVLIAALVLAVALAGASGAAGFQRFLSIARAGDSSIERLTVWRDALQAPLGDPVRILVGFGLETQSAVLERGEATVRLTQNQQWDRAHNLVLDTWLTGGALGVVALVWAIAIAVRATWRARATHGALGAAVIAAFVGHLVEASFAFHTVVTDALFWTLLAFAASLTPQRGHGFARRRRMVGIGVAGAAVLVPMLITPAVADALYGQARRADYVSGAQLEELAAAWAPWVEELPRAAALDWQRVASIRKDGEAGGRAEVDLVAAAARAPAEPLPQLRLVRWYLRAGELAQAEEACGRALERGPYRAAIWDACADVAAAQGRSDVAPLRRARAEELRSGG